MNVCPFNSASKCRLLKTFANSLEPDQALETLMVLLKEFFDKVDFEKIKRRKKKLKKFPRGQRVNVHGGNTLTKILSEPQGPGSR